jgi:Zn-dependent protease with chaperone function
MDTRHRAQIERLETQAARHPNLYRFRLAALAIGGDILLTTAHIAPWVLPIGLGVVFLNQPAFYALGGAVLVFFIYLSRPTLRFQGRALTREEAPVLFAEIDAIRDKLQVRKRMEVMLDDSFNAGALETRGFFGLFGTRRILFLGVPLLAALPRQDVLAVIAHEFGHFSRRHGRLGHWLYRARVGWMELQNEVAQSDIVLDKSTAWIAERLIPYFSRISFVHARHCEYEADADAASVSGGKVFGEALTRVAVLGRLWGEGFPRDLARARRGEAEAPSDFHERFAKAAATWPATELEQWRGEALAEKSDWLDTHPGLSQRLAALKEPCKPTKPAAGAGADLLGTTWPLVLAEFDAQWRQGAEWNWAFEHGRYSGLLAPMVECDEAAAAKLPVKERLERALFLRETDPAKGLAELRELHSQNSNEPSVVFAYGAELLHEKDDTAVPLLESLALERPTFRVPVYGSLARYYARIDSEQNDKWLARLEGATKRRADAVAGFTAKLERGRAGATPLSPAEQAVLFDAISLDPCVERAWLLHGREPLATAEVAHAADLDIHALVLTLDPQILERAGQDEDTGRQRYFSALSKLVAADAAIDVQSYFTTQALPSPIEGYSALFDRRSPVTE